VLFNVVDLGEILIEAVDKVCNRLAVSSPGGSSLLQMIGRARDVV
jgi:hypothetical protein